MVGFCCSRWQCALQKRKQKDAQKAPLASKSAKSGKAAAPAVKPVIEPKAIEILKAASDRLAAAKSMNFTAVVSYESSSRYGPPLVYTTKSDVDIRTPPTSCG